MRTLECHRCHRIGTRGFVPWGSEGWECSNDRACNRRVEEREHGADWSDWVPGDDGPSCKCGYNGTPAECESSREVRQ